MSTAVPTRMPALTNFDRMAPNIILRSALFPAIDASSELEYLKNHLVFAQGKFEILFTGEQFTQLDLDVWFGLLTLFSKSQSDIVIIESERSFIMMLGMVPGGNNVQRVRASINKLNAAHIKIRDQANKQVFGGHLINTYWIHENKQKYACRISTDVIGLFSPGNWTRVDWEIRKSLRKHPIAAWLHGYYSTHRNSKIPIGLETIHKLSGSKNNSMKSFKQKLKQAMALIQEVCRSQGQVFEWVIDSNNNLFVTHSLGKNSESFS